VSKGKKGRKGREGAMGRKEKREGGERKGEGKKKGARRGFLSRTVSELIAAYCSNFGHYVFEPPLGAYGQRTMLILGSLKSA